MFGYGRGHVSAGNISNMIFQRIFDFLDSFPDFLNREIRKAIEAHGLELKEYIIQKQLYDKGEDGNRAQLQGYTRTTIRIKIAKGQPADRTTLKDEGLFYASIDVKAFSNAFAITSDVKYDVNLVKRYGRDILKPNEEHFRQFLDDFLIPNLKKYVNN